MKQADCIICGDVLGYTVCENCEIQLGDDKIAMKCLNCGSYGFIKRNQTNYNRLRTFLNSEDMVVLDSYWVIVIPTKYCPACVEEFNNEYKDS